MHLADAFIQATYIAFKLQFYIYQLLLSLGIEPMILALLVPCSTIWATGQPYIYVMPLFSKPVPGGTPTLHIFKLVLIKHTWSATRQLVSTCLGHV